MYNLFHKKTTVLTFIATCLLTYSALMAEPVRLEQTQKVTNTFLKTLNTRHQKGTMLLSTKAKATTESEASTLSGFRQIRDDDGTILAYISELEPYGFIALSADTDITPIIAYSSESPFPSDDDTTNPLYRMLKEDMKLRLKAIEKNKESSRIQNNNLWNLYSSGESSEDQVFQQWPPENTTSTGGWLETAWYQWEPYSNFCPIDPVDGNRCVTGCIATAIAQIINYHGQCNVYFDQDDSYSTYSCIDIDADSDKYDFPSFEQLNEYLADLRIKYSRQEDPNDTDAAALNFACGIATEMEYSSEGSGASAFYAQEALINKFGFHSANLIGSLSTDYLYVLQENIINGIPAVVCMAPSDGFGGHAVVCDGYNTNSEYHLNFGWSLLYPEPITGVWYNLPTDLMSDLCIVDQVILEIHPVPPGIDIDLTSSIIYSIPGQESEPVAIFIKNNSVQNMSINSISCPEGFLISRDDENYTNQIDSFVIERPGQEALINVKFCPGEAGGYYGTLTINYGQNNTKKVILKGCSLSGGTEIQQGDVYGFWTQDQSPYFIHGDVNIPEDEYLVVDPGVKVIFVGPYSMTIGENALLIAEGSENEPIEFTAWNKDIGWTGMRFINSGDDDILSHCSISYAKKGVEIITLADYYYDELIEEDIYGGALYCFGSSPTIANCKITNNTGDIAGAIYIVHGYPIISNTLIANNASMGGAPQCGGIYKAGLGTPEIKNCTIVNNLPGGVYVSERDGIDITNTIIWGNDRFQIQKDICVAEVTYCDVQGGFPGQGNIDVDPCFFDPSPAVGTDYDGLTANWTLRNSSQCINSGKEIQIPDIDLAGNPRVYSNIVDLGAYENQSELPLITTVSSIDAGCINIAAETAANFDITNTGELDLTIESISILDSNEVFSIVTPIEEHILTPGDSVQAQIKFSPTEEKKYTGALHINSTSSNAPVKPITLRGIGASGTIVPGGEVSGSWAKANSPYTITGNIYIPRDQTLNIEPGVVIQFAGHFGLTSGYRATLRAIGLETENIVFTPMDIEEGWLGIHFINSGDDDILKYCTIEHSNKPRLKASVYNDTLGGGILCCGSYDAEPGYMVASSPTIDHCLISSNYAYVGGAILCIDSSEAQITHNTIIDNSATYGGGGIYIEDASPLISNNIIAHNSAGDSGGIITWYATSQIINNTIVHNRPNGLHLGPSPWSFDIPLVQNNIIWQNEMYISEYVYAEDYEISYNNIQGGFIIENSLNGSEPYEGECNIDTNPLFADPQNRNYHLKSEAGRWDPINQIWQLDDVTSPCIDTGNPYSSVESEALPNGSIINMGAYGGTNQASKSSVN